VKIQKEKEEVYLIFLRHLGYECRTFAIALADFWSAQNLADFEAGRRKFAHAFPNSIRVLQPGMNKNKSFFLFTNIHGRL